MGIIDAIDFPVIDKINAIGGALVVVATYIFGEHWVLFAAVLALNLTDYITGTMKGRMLKKESSSAGLKGIIKKLSYWIMIVIAFGMSPVLNELGEAIGTDLSMLSPIIGWYVLAMLGINEYRSILENLVEMGVNVPTIMIKGLGVVEKVLQKQEELFDGSLDVDPEPSSENAYHVHIETPPEKLVEKDSVTLKIHTIGDDEE